MRFSRQSCESRLDSRGAAPQAPPLHAQPEMRPPPAPGTDAARGTRATRNRRSPQARPASTRRPDARTASARRQRRRAIRRCRRRSNCSPVMPAGDTCPTAFDVPLKRLRMARCWPGTALPPDQPARYRCAPAPPANVSTQVRCASGWVRTCSRSQTELRPSNTPISSIPGPACLPAGASNSFPKPARCPLTQSSV